MARSGLLPERVHKSNQTSVKGHNEGARIIAATSSLDERNYSHRWSEFASRPGRLGSNPAGELLNLIKWSLFVAC